MLPKTSIIMPVYNTEKQVIRAIDSVLAQTDQDFELIIINDCSPDNSDAVIGEYLEYLNDSRVRYIVNERNVGLAATRNRGLQEARGEWLAYLDSDDTYTPHFLETMHVHAGEDIDVVVCAHDVVYPDGSSRYRLRGAAGTFSGYQMMLELMVDRSTPYAWDKIFRHSAVAGMKFPIINRVEDAGYSIPVYRNVNKVCVIEDSLVLYSVNPESITWGSVPPIKEMYKFVEYLKESTETHRGNNSEKNAMAVSWVLTFLNGAQSALRLLPDGAHDYLTECRKALRWPLLARTVATRPTYGFAGILLKLSPALYKILYGAYVKKMYGI